MVWGPVSDYAGRRPVFLACLFILSLTCVGLALVPVSAYWLLMVLRCLQAAGSASTIALEFLNEKGLGAGVIGDISTPKERGGFYGMFSIGPMVGPSIGPVVGGVLSQHLGWRFLPETLRSLVGDGSVPPPLIYRPVIPIIKTRGEPCYESRPERKKLQNPLRLLGHVDIIVLLVLNAIATAVYNAFTATISTLLASAYPFLSETEIGLCFLGIGGGMLVGGVGNGKMLDWEYRRLLNKVKGTEEPTTDQPKEKPAKQTVPEDFPIEKARLRLLPLLVALLVVCSCGYGWCIQRQVNLAGPLILQIIVGYISISIMNSTQTLMIDLFPGQGSSISACIVSRIISSAVP
ncbi:hypothetical protein H0H92_004890 [Tricholoma furcatifolium]|nr:hypothetical protein H0H92_004890 [Tricholoma furcatifolium]